MYFFKKSTNFDIKKNKIYTSSMFPNVRFHYMDIRELITYDYKKYFSNLDVFDVDTLVEYYYSNNFYLSDESIEMIIELFGKIHDNYIFINNSLFENKKSEKIYNEKMYSREYIFDEQTAKNIIRKMCISTDENVKNILKNIKKKYVKPKISKIVLLIKKIIYLLNEYIKFNNNYIDTDKYKNKFTKLKINLYYTIYDFSGKTGILGAILTDMYFIRRFMDKKYIENSIIYSGMYHTMDYIFILIKYFNFKITHFSYSNTDINIITEIIKKSKNNFNVDELYNLFIPYNNIIYQCSNMTTFPDKFL